MNEISQYRENWHPTPKFDKIESQERIIAQMEGVFWKIFTEKQQKPQDWLEWPLENGTFFVGDPEKIKMSTRPADNSQGPVRGWKSIGTLADQTKQLVIRPHATELDFKRLPGLKFSHDYDYGAECTFMINTLKVTILPPEALSQEDFKIVGNRDTCAEIIIERVDDEGNTGDMKTRNPMLAKTSLSTDLKIMYQQLREMGYETITCHPTDERRARVYQKMGFIPLPSPGEWYMRLD